MNIKNVSLGLVASTLISGIFSSCYDNKYEEKAKSKAIKYLNGSQLIKAEIIASQQPNNDSHSGEAIAYWDNLLIEAKAKEAYVLGQELVRDRAKKVLYREKKFVMPLDTILPNDIIVNSRNEYAKYTSAKDFISARDNAPSDYSNVFSANQKAASTHYWNLITLAGRQQEAYKKGIDDENERINKSKTNLDITPLQKAAINAVNTDITNNIIESNIIIESLQKISK